jgi:glucosamine--fructose-6-phosphate aminotransferase (isomerizing)
MWLPAPSAGLAIYDSAGEPVQREMKRVSSEVEDADLGDFEHYMLKEIYEQPHALAATFAKAADGEVDDSVFGAGSRGAFEKTDAVQIVACGTSYHAGLVARYWLEDIAGIPCQVEVASEFRYRRRVAPARDACW